MADQKSNAGPGGQCEPSTMPTPPTTQPPTPGLLELRELNINKGQITLMEEKFIQRTISDQVYILNRRIHSPQILNAARNVAGLLFYHSYKKDKAIKFWQETVECDPQNLNALQDLATAYRKLRNNRKAIEYECKIKEFQDNASDKDKQLMMARCQLEQAYAQFWDFHTESWSGVEKRKKQVESYEAGLDFAGKLYDEERHQLEKRDWLLYTAQAHERLSHAFFRMGDHTNYLKAIGTTIEILHDVREKCEQSDRFLAEVWYVMGNTFARNEGSLQSEVTLPRIVAKTYDKEWKDSSLCYVKALKLDPHNVWILGRLGIHWFKKKNNTTKALKFLTESIEAADKHGEDNHMKNSCWNALCHRAKINMKEAKFILKRQSKESYELLQQATQDSSRAVEYNFSPMTLAVDGEAHHLLARHPYTSRKYAEDLRNIALQRFYEASVCQDGQSISNTHLKWADCLMDEQDLPSAIASYKVAFETAHDTSGSFKITLASKLLPAMLQNFTNEKKPDYLLKELVFCFTHIHRHCKPTLFEFDRLLWKNASAVLDVMECLVCKTPLPSDEMYLYEKMIQPALKDFSKMLEEPKFTNRLQQLNCTDFESRLKNLIEGNERNINNCPTSRPKSPGAASLRDHQEPPDQPLAEGVKYDFCVIYDTGDDTVEGWVEFFLLSGLECPFYGLKGYFYKRDLHLGTTRLQEWTSALTQSAYILIILTHKMNTMSTLLREISQTIEGKDIIVIQREATEVPIPLRICRKFDFTVQSDIPELARYLMPRKMTLFM
ncbi:uncharacterized protein [Diadema setosum]|uniref:uncharacterized protein n=1 Tax=Diadema setosum TaxID=31175 RepID=UPI003B3BD391